MARLNEDKLQMLVMLTEKKRKNPTKIPKANINKK